MPIPQVRSFRLSVFCLAVFALLLLAQPSFAFRWTWLVPSDRHVDFGTLKTGTRVSLPEVLKNAGKSPVTVMSARLSGSGFVLTAPSLPVTLLPGQSVTLKVTFSPTANTNYGGTLIINYSRANNLFMNIPVVGTGTGAVSISAVPASLSFGSVSVGSSASKTASLTATGSSAVLSSVTTTNPEFRVSGITLPVTVKAGQTLPFTVKFSPQSAGSANARLSFATSGSSSVAAQTLSGSGIAPSAVDHSVSLSWRASTSTVTGYNVYRGTTSGGPYSQINVSLDKALSYADTTVQGGETYFYVLTAVDGSGKESPHSNQATAVVPNP